MTAIFLMLFGMTIGLDPKFKILGLELIYWCMAVVFLSYIRYALRNIKSIKIDNTMKWLIAFEVWGAIMVVISFLGLNASLAGPELMIDKSYIPRHAIYLFFMPAIIVMAEPEYKKILNTILSKYRIPLFWGIYLYNVLLKGEFSLFVIPVFVLAMLSLCEKSEYRIIEWLMFLAVMITPVAVGGEITNVMLRVIYAMYFLFKNRKKQVTFIIATGAAVCLVLVFIIPFFMDYITPHVSYNTSWRALYWRDEIIQFIQSKGIGVGFGTAYATPEFVGNQPSIPGNAFDPVYRQHSVEYLMMTTGPHNSFISVVFRMGIVGIVTFIGFLYSIFIKAYKNIKDTPIYAFFAFFAAIVIISVNVGIETPMYLIAFIFANIILYMNAVIKEK